MESYSLRRYFTGLLSIIFIIISDEAVQADANFESLSTTAKVFENDSVLLPCYLKERHTRIRWFDEENKLIADSQFPELQVDYGKLLHPNGSLEVMNIKMNDTGSYICEALVGYRVYKQKHEIEVQVPPDVLTHPTGVKSIPLGGIFQITCEARGVPYPMISWEHNKQKVTNLDDGNRRYTVEVKHYDMAGLIECIADNGVGQPASNGLLLFVNFAPEVIVKNPIVHTKSGSQAKLECIVFSHPTAQIHWFFDGRPVTRSSTYISLIDSDLPATEVLPSYYSKKRHVLIIRNVRDSDLGKYECKAENTIGLGSGKITLMGNPLKPKFEDKSQPATSTSKVLSWQTESLSPIIDYTFKFHLEPTGNENFHSRGKKWTSLTIPADRDTTGPFHTKSYKLIGLQPSRVYDVIIQARNQYGQSEQSNVLRFSTPAATDIISSSSTESNEYDSHSEADLWNEIYPTPFNAGCKTHSTATAAVSFTVFYIFCRIFL